MLHQIGNGMALCTENLGWNFIWALLAKSLPSKVHSPSGGSGSDLVRALLQAHGGGGEVGSSSSAALRVRGKRPATQEETERIDVNAGAAALKSLMHAGGQSASASSSSSSDGKKLRTD